MTMIKSPFLLRPAVPGRGPRHPIGRALAWLAALELAALAAGAASPPKSVATATPAAPLTTTTTSSSSSKRPGPGYIFYPLPPEPPRLQFLVSYSDEKDLGLRPSRLATFITGAQAPSQPIVKPYGVVLANQQLHICDTANRCLSILDLERKTMRQFRPAGPGRLGTPVNLAIDTDGTRYVADTGRGQVLVFSADDTFQGVVGTEKGLRPTGVALSPDRIYVADVNSRSIRAYAKSGRKLLFTIPPNREPLAEGEASKNALAGAAHGHGQGQSEAKSAKAEADEEDEKTKEPPKSPPGDLAVPVNLTLDATGRLFVSDTAACRIQVYDADGKYLRTLGSEGDQPGQFARPKGVAVDRDGRTYVVDAASQVCQIFDAEGRLLIFFGEPNGSPASLDLPAGIWVDEAHVGLFKKHAAPDFEVERLVIITNQYGDRKVSVYGLGHKKG